MINISGSEAKPDYDKIDYKEPIPNSKQMRLFAYDEVREFNQSSYKRTYLSEKSDLLENGYVDWLVNRINEIGIVEFDITEDFVGCPAAL